MGVCCGSSNQNRKVKVEYKIVNYHQNMEKIVDFWFQMDDNMGYASNLAYDRESNFPQALKKKWFKPDPSGLDIQVKKMFREDFQNLAQGKYISWEDHKEGRLAIVLLADQLSRMYYRNQKEQFNYDNVALRVCKKIIKDPEEFNKYRLIEKLFLIFPLMHSEHRQDSELLVLKITELIAYAKARGYEDVVDTMASFLKAAQTFTQILTVYKRFPHRNQLLGRMDTPEEIEYNEAGKIPDHHLKKYKLKPQKNTPQRNSKYNDRSAGVTAGFGPGQVGSPQRESFKQNLQYNKGLGQVRIGH